MKVCYATSPTSLIRAWRSRSRYLIKPRKSPSNWLLKQEPPKIVKYIIRQLHEKFVKTKVCTFLVLKELVLPNCLAGHVGSLIPRIEKALSQCQDRSTASNLKIEALIFTRLVLALPTHQGPCKTAALGLACAASLLIQSSPFSSLCTRLATALLLIVLWLFLSLGGLLLWLYLYVSH